MDHLPIPNIEKWGISQEDDTEERTDLWEAIRNPENPVHRTLVPVTVKWLVRLPVKIRPLLLASHFPRIANQLAIAWGFPAQRKKMVEDLLWDQRGDRKGFPTPVYHELQTLHHFLMGPFSTGEARASSAVLSAQAEEKES